MDVCAEEEVTSQVTIKKRGRLKRHEAAFFIFDRPRSDGVCLDTFSGKNKVLTPRSSKAIYGIVIGLIITRKPHEVYIFLNR